MNFDLDQFGSFCELPVDIIFNIFQFLSLRDVVNAGRVCHSWRNAMQDPRLWEQLIFTKDDKPSFIVQCLRNAQQLKWLTYVKCSGIVDVYHEKKNAVPSCYSVKGLEFLHSSVSTSQLSAIVRLYPKLTSLSFADSQVTFPDCLHALTSLNDCLVSLILLSYCCTLSDNDVLLLADSFPLLIDLDIEGNPYVTDTAVSYLLKTRGACMKILRVDGENLSDLFTLSLCFAPGLKQFSIAYAENLSSHGFCVILKSLRQLNTLRLHKVINLIDDCIADTILRCPWLRSITHLELNDCQQLGDCSAIALAKVCSFVKYLSMDWWVELTDVALKEIVTTCSQLEFLSIVGAVRVVGKSSFDQNLAILTPRLHEVRLEKCHSFDDNLFASMISLLPRLRIVNFYGEFIEKTPQHHTE